MSHILTGKEIVITRSKNQAGEMLRLIKERGANAFLFPVIETVWPKDIGPLDYALEQIIGYDWILFTSVNGVRFFFQRVEELYGLEIGTTLIKGKKIVAIGPKTANALEKHGVHVSTLPTSFKQENLVQEITNQLKTELEYDLDDPITKELMILFPRAKSARKYLGEQLSGLGVQVDEVEVYQTIKVNQSKEAIGELLEKLKHKQIDVITFTSSSTVRNFVEILKASSWQDYLDSVTIACIGPITTQTARKLGLVVTVEAATYTIEGLMEQIEQYFIKKKV